MIKSTYISLKTRLLSNLPSSLLRDEKGIAAIEFAFVAPIMIAMYFGMAEVAAAISVDRQISHSANVAGDLTTQSEKVSLAEMTEIMTATMLVMGVPEHKKEGVTIEIASFARAADDSIIKKGKATLKGIKGIDLPTFEANDLDQRILSSSSGVVVARVNYLYEPLKLRYLPDDFNISEVFMLKPRKSANVDIHETDAGGILTSNNYDCDFIGSNNEDGTPNENAGKVRCSTAGTLN